jgi:hypothetical protein
LTHLETLDANTQGVDPARVLVADRKRRLDVVQRAGVPFVDEMQIRTTGAGGADPHDQLSRARLGFGHVPQFGRVLPLGKL